MTDPFESLTDEYDEWYDTNAEAYRTEQAALERAIPDDVDRERALEVARERGIEPVREGAEALPIGDVYGAIEDAGFEIDERYQTVFSDPAELEGHE
ncbi:hypothetical protein ACYJ1Y_05465 [Natrialbaceae archaeon A-gly3]